MSATHVRSRSKINLGLCIGPPRPDGFHDLVTLYQTIAPGDLVSVTAITSAATAITLSCNHPRVPTDGRNTAFRIVAAALEQMGTKATVHIHLQKTLPMQGGMGAGSANAAAALLGLERQLGRALPLPQRMAVAAAVGSDVPLFLIGGTVYGHGRGELVQPFPDLPSTPCVIALPGIGSSTPLAFRAWDAGIGSAAGQLTPAGAQDRLTGLSRVYASAYTWAGNAGIDGAMPPLAGVHPTAPILTGASGVSGALDSGQLDPSGQQRPDESTVGDLAGNTLLRLVRTGIENDFEAVVFQQHPSLRVIKLALQGIEIGVPEESHAMVASLSGSGSSLFGLYRSAADASLAQQRVRALGVEALVTTTLTRRQYWSGMFASSANFAEPPAES